MPVCPPPAPTIIGTFLIGTRTIGVPRTDATCGVGVCGETTLAVWYAYLCNAGLGLSAVQPTIIQSVDVVLSTPSAGLGLTGSPPAIYTGYILTIPPAALALAAATPQTDTGYPVPAAGLGLSARAPLLSMSAIVSVAPAGLGLSVDMPLFAGQIWITPEVCIGSPDESICGEVICGDGHVCGGYSFIVVTDCLVSLDPSIIGTFLIGTRLIGGPAFDIPMAPPLLLDLPPLVCK